VRSALRALLEAEDEFEVVAEAGEVEEAVRKVLAYKPKVIVLDLSMPGGSSWRDPHACGRRPRPLRSWCSRWRTEPRFARERCGRERRFRTQGCRDAELVAAVRAAIQASGISIRSWVD